MEISIKKKGGYYDCLDTLIVTIADYWELDYEYMLYDTWDFKFSPPLSSTESLLGTRISDNSKSNYSVLRDYHEFSIEFNPITDLDDFLNVLRTELANDRPVAVMVDTFWCPWIKYQYQKTHRDHYCLVTGIDDNNNMQVIESQLATTPKLLPYSHFKEGYHDYIIFSKTKPRVSNVFDWRKSILEKIESFYINGHNNSIFEQMRLFSKMLPEQLNIVNEIIGFELIPFKSPLYQKIYNIGKRRLQYSDFLKYISKKYRILELDSFSKQFHSIGTQWQSVFGLLSKAYYTPDKSKIIKKVSDKIGSLSEIEEQLSSDLYNFCLNNSFKKKNNNEIQNNQKHISNRIESFLHIDLLEYFNNNGVSDSYEITGTSEFSNGGKYFDATDFPNQRFIQIENMNFRLPEIRSNSFDNISCSGQELRLTADSPKYIMFLGCSELGSHSEYVEIIYANGEKKELLIEFTNYCKSLPIFDERMAWENRVLQRQNEQVNEYPRKGYFYAKNYALDNQDTIVSIKLPECLNLHIFAITLGF